MKTNKVKVVKEGEVQSVGRPNKYDSKFAPIAYKLCLLGLTDKQVAETLCVSESTLNNWKKQYGELLESLTRGKTLADGNVAMGLYQRATGYDYASEKLFMTKNGEILREPITIHVPPDPGAAKIWLTNRQPNLWSDKQHIEHCGIMQITMDLNGGDAGDGDASTADLYNDVEEIDYTEHLYDNENDE